MRSAAPAALQVWAVFLPRPRASVQQAIASQTSKAPRCGARRWSVLCVQDAPRCASNWQRCSPTRFDEVESTGDHARKKSNAWGEKDEANTKDMFEKEFKRRATNMMDALLNGSKEQEKYMQEWTTKLHNAARRC